MPEIDKEKAKSLSDSFKSMEGMGGMGRKMDEMMKSDDKEKKSDKAPGMMEAMARRLNLL